MFSRYGFRTIRSASIHQKFLSSKIKSNLLHKIYNKSLNFDEIIMISRAVSGRTQSQTIKESPPPQHLQPQQASEASQKKTQLQQVNETQNQLTQSKQVLYKIKDKEIDSTSKKLGWLLSGSAIAFISALYGKLYLLFGAVPLFLYHSKDIDIMSKTFNRDVLFLWRSTKCWWLSKRIKNQNLTLPKVFQQMAKKYSDRMMLQMHDQNWKYKDVASYANRTSRLMQKYGFQKGDIVAMFALSSPEMVAIVLGLANIGVITALINTDLRNKGLTEAILNSRCKGIIFDDELIHAFGDVYKNLNDIKIFQTRHKAKRPEFHVLEEELLKEFNDAPEMFINIHHDDPLLYMYSPEDTDYKEPIVITHAKFLFNSSATSLMLDLKPSEKIYNPTPLHDPTGIILGIGPSITNAVPTVLRSKFSATDYFKECYVYNCTVGQYTGTMCKHLLLSPVSPIETFHPVKVMYGNGMESDYWQEFVNRFGTKMYEVHDPSEENINLINMEGKIGVVGFRPKLAPSVLFPHYIIKVFGNEKIPIRDPRGYCQLCDYGEPGMLVRLWNSNSPLPPKIKTIANIFKNGDVAITNGEILTFDENLYLRQLKKHTNKTWMNKLVTTEEVEYIASKLTSKRCAAYSLSMDNKQDIEILAIEDPNRKLDMKKFTDDLVDHLPKDWVPHYVRITPKFELLESGKVNKKSLIIQGLNMEDNLVYYFDKKSMSYNPLIWTHDRTQIIVHDSSIHGLTRAAQAPVTKTTTAIKSIVKFPASRLESPSTTFQTPQKTINKQIAERFNKFRETRKVIQDKKSLQTRTQDPAAKMLLASNAKVKSPITAIESINTPAKPEEIANSIANKFITKVEIPTIGREKPPCPINADTNNIKIGQVENVADKSINTTEYTEKLARPTNVATSSAKTEPIQKLTDKSILSTPQQQQADEAVLKVSDKSVITPQQKDKLAHFVKVNATTTSIKLDAVQNKADKSAVTPEQKEKLLHVADKIGITPQQTGKLAGPINVPGSLPKIELVQNLADKEVITSQQTEKLVRPINVLRSLPKVELVQNVAEKGVFSAQEKEKLARLINDSTFWARPEPVQKGLDNKNNIAPKQMEKLAHPINVTASLAKIEPVQKVGDKSAIAPQQKEMINNHGNKVKLPQAQVSPANLIKPYEQKEKSKQTKTEQAVIFINKTAATTTATNANKLNPLKSSPPVEDKNPIDASNEDKKDGSK